MTRPTKIVYTAHAHTTGGREGQAKSSDGLLDVTCQPASRQAGY